MANSKCLEKGMRLVAFECENEFKKIVENTNANTGNK
jgi:hypothetical protein